MGAAMRLIDRQGALSQGLADIRAQFAVPSGFPAAVLAEADVAAAKPIAGRADWTAKNFVTLDPKSSTDLDQAFSIERSAADLILFYAIADTAWFVQPDWYLDREAWARGETIYLPDGKASLYPPSAERGSRKPASGRRTPGGHIHRPNRRFRQINPGRRRAGRDPVTRQARL